MKKMKPLSYKWLLIFFMLWLPIQGATAAILSVCAQEDSNSCSDKTLIANADCHNQMANNTTDHLLTSFFCEDISCDTYSNTPILLSYTLLIPPNDILSITSFNPGFTSFIPEQPQRPPLIASF